MASGQWSPRALFYNYISIFSDEPLLTIKVPDPPLSMQLHSSYHSHVVNYMNSLTFHRN